MTDPTTRYPLPDDPGVDPLATPPAPDAEPAMTTAAADATTATPVATTAATATTAPPTTAPPTPAATATTAPPPPTPAPAAWTPPKDDGSRWPAIVFGLILIAVGLWFLAEVTLGLDLPTIRWGQLWPLILIVVGALILYGSRLGRSR
jgi:uncharacterized integral membrane protein